MGPQAKYRAKPTFVHGFRFASRAEARRYGELLLIGGVGEIRNLELQPRFPLHVGGVQVAVYVADFRYEERRFEKFPCIGSHRYEVSWLDVVEDVKGMKTPVYRIKRKHFEAEYGLQIRETR